MLHPQHRSVLCHFMAAICPISSATIYCSDNSSIHYQFILSLCSFQFTYILLLFHFSLQPKISSNFLLVCYSKNRNWRLPLHSLLNSIKSFACIILFEIFTCSIKRFRIFTSFSCAISCLNIFSFSTLKCSHHFIPLYSC